MKKVLFIFLGLILTAIIVFYSIIKYQDANPEIFYNEITKIYYAPKSKIKIIINSKNYVVQNQDLGTGTAFVKLYVLNAKTDTVYLKTSPENIDFITFKNKKIPFDCGQMEKHKLFDYLTSINFKNLNKNEINELRNAMTFINYGLKATLLKGQTKFIKVVE
jgi:hypothetical protein